MDKITFEGVKKIAVRELVNGFSWTTIIALALQDHVDRTEFETMLKYGGECQGHTTRPHSTSVILKYQKLITDTINHFDVRCVHTLINAVESKQVFPKWLRDGNYTIDMDDNCQWCLFKK